MTATACPTAARPGRFAKPLARGKLARRLHPGGRRFAMQFVDSLDISSLLQAYRAGRATPAAVMAQLLDAADAAAPRNLWITRLTRSEVMAHVRALERHAATELPLYGIPFVIKDNIDLAGVPTTAGCPDYAYTPARSATVVERLMAAGAIPLGKTNLDQFATGLVGTRSPYGACGNAFDANYIAGGSSSGSAVAVALGLASFSLGTDTAGSGRVPAAFNNLVGLKPSLGRLSTRGVVPACRSIDCVSIFALTAADAARVLESASGFDAEDAYSRAAQERPIGGARIGVPRASQLEFFGDRGYAAAFARALEHLAALGATLREIDFAPFLEAARLLYEGPWVAERYAAVGEFIEAHPQSVHPVTRRIIEGGRQPSAAAAYRAGYRLMELKRASEAAWRDVELIVTPTAATTYTIAELEADPIRLNSNLGVYTNYMNLFDLAGVACPAGRREDGLPFGVTLIGPTWTEQALLGLAGRLQPACNTTLGARPWPVPAAPPHPAAGTVSARPSNAPPARIAVCGAHMRALPLNPRLRLRRAQFIACARTAPHYRLIALTGEAPPRPGLIRVTANGAAIELEVWSMPLDEFGALLAEIGAPLGLGRVELQSGEFITGFLCEAHAAAGALDITQHGGWRAYLAARESGARA